MKIMQDSPIRFPGLFGDWEFTVGSVALDWVHARVEVNLVALRSPCDAFYIVLIVGSKFLHETSEILRVEVSKNFFHICYEKALLVGFITVSFHTDEGDHICY